MRMVEVKKIKELYLACGDDGWIGGGKDKKRLLNEVKRRVEDTGKSHIMTRVLYEVKPDD